MQNVETSVGEANPEPAVAPSPTEHHRRLDGQYAIPRFEKQSFAQGADELLRRHHGRSSLETAIPAAMLASSMASLAA